MKQMGYQACKADTDLWTKAVVRADDGNQVLCIPFDLMLITFGLP